MINLFRDIVLFFSGLLSADEKERFEKHLHESENAGRVSKRFQESVFSSEDFYLWKQIDSDKAFKSFEQRIGFRRKIFSPLRIYSGVAAVAVVAVASWWLFVQEHEKTNFPEPEKEMIVVGSAKAILRLETGELLDLADEDLLLNNELVTNEAGKLSYHKVRNTKIAYNELIIPLGGEYHLELADGTVVYLNSGTRLKYPTAFHGDIRSVELLEGEAFFSVAKDSLRPFYVDVDGMDIRVYGTEFNVNMYDSAHVYTTLVAGKVGIILEEQEQEFFLKPSMQANFDRESGKVDVYPVNTALHASWKDGRYVFQNESLGNILKTLGVWYDFDVKFLDENLKLLHFSGNVKRYEEINKIVDAINYAVGIDIRIDGKYLIISK